ncbi:MAG TPA: cadmium-translocating P-type ATPase [Anaerolinea thermolimosa]|uniref:Cadmium-translocating P-type ATPase n=1 Tax=Anaerolinea thermolimosa TaxID=229919 RepID=A0A3D1JDH1_9CHLR|nr:cadmium-translocating P-type ATPase [Anaerolinea thermolimosa]
MSHQTYSVEGMDCADCARHIEEGVSRLPGVTGARVHFATGLLEVEGAPDEKALRARVESLGYRLKDPANPAEEKPGAGAGGFIRFLLAASETRLALIGGAILLLSLLVEPFRLPAVLGSALQIIALGVAGWPVARAGLANLWINRSISINLLMTIAALGAVVIGDIAEAATLIFLFDLAEALEGYTTERARRTLGELRSLAPHLALRVSDAGEALVAVEDLRPGDRILVRAGERIPIDGEVLRGNSEVDQSPITGESIPVEKGPGAKVFAGSVNGRGVLEVKVTHHAEDTTLARIVRMVTEAQNRRAPSQRFIDRFATWYTPVVVGVAVLVAIIPPLFFGQPFLNSGGETGWLYRALALLVIACPCALVISAPVTIISAITAAARQGVLFKGGVYLEALAQVKQVAFDKTGTLTRGSPSLTRYRAEDCANGGSCEPSRPCEACGDVLALAAALEKHSTHPLAQAVVGAAQRVGLDTRYPPAEELTSLNGRGLQGRVAGQLATIGNHALFDAYHPHSDRLCAEVNQAEAQGQTAMLLCDGQRVRGYLAVADTLRPASPAVVAELKRLGLRTTMLTGDNPAVAQEVGAQLGISEVRAGLLPEDKVEAVRQLAATDGRLAMVGDGINDAPALSAAEVGVAVGGAGSAAAMETADVVLMSGDLSRLPFAVRLARRTLGLIRQNVAVSLGIKLLFILLALNGWATLWMAVAADMGVSLLVTLNGMRPLRMKA